jgi:exodeoxyribonuclease VII large subunit
VTSPSGAAIQDILNILKRRAPHIPVVIVPSLVQGEEAPGQMISALELVNQHQLGDLIILARGGGSIEDLWCFNHEGLARAIRKSSLPVVSAVGHEIDFTISDFVSDLRAPTPSAAAEIVSQYYVDAYQNIHEMIARLSAPLIRNLLNRKSLLSLISARVVSPKDRLREQAQRTDDLCLRLERAFHARFEKKQASLKQLVGKLDALSPLRVLERGYALVRDPNSNWTIVKSGDRLQSGQELQVIFYDSQRSVQVL